MTSIREALQWQVDACAKLGRPGATVVAQMVLRRGHVYAGQPLPKPYRKRPVKACFRNARLLAQSTRWRLRYVEGFALQPYMPLPVEHAWCVDDQDNVIDPTWSEPETGQYLGVPMNRDLYAKLASTSDTFSVFQCWRGVNREAIDWLCPNLLESLNVQTRAA